MDRSTEEKHLIRSSVRKFLLLKMRPEEIRKALADADAMDGHPVKLSRSSLYRYLESIKGEDAKWLEGMAHDGFVLEYRMAVETLAAQEQELMKIRQRASKDSDKIAATIAIKDIELERINLLVDGPTLWALKKQAERAKVPMNSPAAL